MKRIIDGLLYDTEKSEKLHEWRSSAMPLGWYETLYQTAKGTFFVHSTSPYETSAPVKRLTDKEALRWLETHGGEEVLLERFPEYVEEA